MDIGFIPYSEDGNRFYDRYTDPGELAARYEHRDLPTAPEVSHVSHADNNPAAASDDDYRPRRRSPRGDGDHEAPDEMIGPEGDDE